MLLRLHAAISLMLRSWYFTTQVQISPCLSLSFAMSPCCLVLLLLYFPLSLSFFRNGVSVCVCMFVCLPAQTLCYLLACLLWMRAHWKIACYFHGNLLRSRVYRPWKDHLLCKIMYFPRYANLHVLSLSLAL